MTTGSKTIDQSPYFRYAKSWGGTDWSSPSPPSGLESYWKRVEEAASTPGLPGFQKVRGVKSPPKRASIEDHPYSMSLEVWNDQQMAWIIHSLYPPFEPIGSGSAFFRYLYSVGYSSNFESGWGSNEDIGLIGALREKIVGSDFDMGVFLGEGREALSLITSTANRVYSFYRGFRRLDVKAMSRALGVPESRVARAMSQGRDDPVHVRAARANLELQYGWLPLLGDAHSGAQALAQQLNFPAVQTYRVRRRVPLSATVVSPNISDFEYDGFIQAQYIARVKEANVAALNGLVDPSTVLWELTPWSFVADWFIPIGNYLQARGFANSVTGTFVKTITRREVFSSTGAYPKNRANRVIVDANYKHQRVTVVRTVSSSVPVPKPSFKPLAEVLSWKRALNAVSLITVNLPRILSSKWR